jgi:hypothetical protein
MKSKLDSLADTGRFMKLQTFPTLKIITSSLLLAISANSVSQTPASSQVSNDTTIYQSMSEIQKVTSHFYPLLVRRAPDSQKALEPAQKSTLEHDLQQLNLHMGQLAADMNKRPHSVRITYNTITSQLEQSLISLKQGNEGHALSLLSSSTHLCTACHNQDHSQRKHIDQPILTILDNDFHRAEYLYMTRQYQDAKRYYLSSLQTAQARYDHQTISTLDRLLVIAIDIDKQPAEFRQWLSQFSNQLKQQASQAENSALNPLLRDIEYWIKGIDNKQSTLLISNLDHNKAKKLIKEHVLQYQGTKGPVIINEEKRPFYIWLRGQLHRLAYQENQLQAQDDRAELLYWLAICDRVLEYQFQYSLSELYLKECIVGYPGSKYARQCYNELERDMVFSYSGSSGTHIPEDVKNSLETLKQSLRP